MENNINTQLKDQLAVVTGGSQGIGFAIAQRLLREGARVVISGRSTLKLDEAVVKLAVHGQVHAVACDLANAEGCSHLVDALTAYGEPDVLINNVGTFEVRPFFECDDEHWFAMFELNVMSGVRLSRALMSAILRKGRGRILFIASEQSVKPSPYMAHYAMSKTAQVSVARSLAELTKGTLVTVNSLLVAPTWTEGVEAFLEPVAAAKKFAIDAMRAEYFKGDGLNSLIQRFASPSEIADVACFLASPLSSAINGAALRADGGIIRSLF